MRWFLASAIALVVLASCTPAVESPPVGGPGGPTRASTPRQSETPATSGRSETPSTPAEPTSPPATLMLPSGEPTLIAGGLQNPWSLVFVDERPLFTQRGRATISTVVDGDVVEVARIPEVVAAAEGGLLGLAVSPGAPEHLYVYYTAADDNRVVRHPILLEGDRIGLGPATVILDGIPKARGHNGGRMAFGPDGKLYIGTGDAGERERSQDRDSLGGKILRINPDGSVPADNPFGTAVWSYGHRNVQGLAWDDGGRMWATEFGQNTWDELNVITPGGNYGWPVVEGVGEREGFVDPVVVWRPEEASPSGLLYLEGNLYAASLRGERLWVMLTADPAGTATDTLVGGPGRLRDVVAAPDGTIWVLTSNNSKDVILSYQLIPA